MRISAHTLNRVIYSPRFSINRVSFSVLFLRLANYLHFFVVLFGGIYLGLWIVLGTLLWWVFGTTGLAVLLYFSVTFTSTRRCLPS